MLELILSNLVVITCSSQHRMLKQENLVSLLVTRSSSEFCKSILSMYYRSCLVCERYTGTIIQLVVIPLDCIRVFPIHLFYPAKNPLSKFYLISLLLPILIDTRGGNLNIGTLDIIPQRIFTVGILNRRTKNTSKLQRCSYH